MSTAIKTDPIPSPITLRTPESQDGHRVHALVQQCRPLDENSVYCNLLQCSHFADTCVAAEQDGELVGFISGYILPKQPNVLFIWQVAVHESARQQGLALRMLNDIAERDVCADVQFLETTITPDNDASRALFQRFAYQRSVSAEEFILFDSRVHFSGEHQDENLMRIGPFNLNDA